MHSASLSKTAAFTMLFFYNFCSGSKDLENFSIGNIHRHQYFSCWFWFHPWKSRLIYCIKKWNENWKKLAVCSVLGPLPVLPLGDFVYICLHCGWVETWLINATEFFCHANQNCIINITCIRCILVYISSIYKCSEKIQGLKATFLILWKPSQYWKLSWFS